MRPGRDHWWHELVDGQPAEAETADTAAEDLLMIIYTSGTTGRSKGQCTHCGFPVKAAQDMAFGTDVHGEILFTDHRHGLDDGAMAGVRGHAAGATFCLYDGAPDYPTVERLWALAERHRIAAGRLADAHPRPGPHGDEPVKRHDLSAVRFFASTGEPWNPTRGCGCSM